MLAFFYCLDCQSEIAGMGNFVIDFLDEVLEAHLLINGFFVVRFLIDDYDETPLHTVMNQLEKKGYIVSTEMNEVDLLVTVKYCAEYEMNHCIRCQQLIEDEIDE